jgi:GT2 family glycosyltransferase
MSNGHQNTYHSLRRLYLDFPVPFSLKKSIKNACFEAISSVWGDAAFLREWQAKRKLDQRTQSFSIYGQEVYGGEDEFNLYAMAREWQELLKLSKDQISESLIPRIQKSIRASHLCKRFSPQVSILIPAYGNPLYTLSCVASLIKQETTHAFDIHISDDNPDDPFLAGYIARLESEHLYYHLNRQNLGFTRNINQAAARPESELIVFLNNDTYCHPLWLDQLVATYDRLVKYSRVGVIGSKVLHKNLLIQECGCLLDSDGIPDPLGRGKKAFDPQFSYLREVDFVSACSMLMKKDLFLELGGFDERFSPGYYEDPELCQRLKDKGYTNYVQPSSVLIHEEGASFGKDGFENVKAEKLNLFNSIHPKVRSINTSFQAKPRVLFIDAYLPMPDKGSGSIDAMAFIHYFHDRGYRITFYAQQHDRYFEKYTTSLESLGIEVLQNQFRPIETFLKEEAATIKLVFVSRFYQFDHFLPLIKRKLSHACLIYNTVDLHFLREEREAAIEDQFPAYLEHLQRLKKKELEYLSIADASIVISSYEYDLLQKIMPTVTSIYHVPQCRPFIGSKEPYASRNGLLFIGSAHQPNVDALRYFQSELHPLLVQVLPDYHLSVIGQELHESLSRTSDTMLLKNPNISFLGFIENVTPIFDRSIAMIVPLRFGSGIKGKVIQAIQHSLPCIATDIGAEGLDLPPDSSVLIANTPTHIVEKIMKLTTDQHAWEKYSNLAYPTFIERFSDKVFKKKMDELMTKTAN